MTRAFILAAALAFGPAAIARPLADGAAARALPDPARETAAQHFRAGSARYAAHDYEAALAEFEAGYATKPSPAFLVNIGQCLRKLDRLDQAALAYRRFLDARVGSATTRLEVFDAFEDTLAELNRRIDALAQSAAFFRAYLAGGDGDAALRAKTQATLDEIMRELVRIDDGLSAGYGVGRGLALPSSCAEREARRPTTAAPQRLASTAATTKPTATRTNQRSLRSANHSHIAR